MENARPDKLKDFDIDMEQLLKDWNAPGVGVGIVVNDKLVFTKGYGYRDYEKHLPFMPTTLFPIASNIKLFTAVAAGLLVAEGKLTWDWPIHEAVPSIRFYNDMLNNSVTLRDMLAHRTGITRHDTIWYESDFSRKVSPARVCRILYDRLAGLGNGTTHSAELDDHRRQCRLGVGARHRVLLVSGRPLVVGDDQRYGRGPVSWPG